MNKEPDCPEWEQNYFEFLNTIYNYISKENNNIDMDLEEDKKGYLKPVHTYENKPNKPKLYISVILSIVKMLFMPFIFKINRGAKD